MNRQVQPDRTNWRDEVFSKRHRDFYGFDCPAADVDFLLVEHSFGKPAAIIDYKRPGGLFKGSKFNQKALAELGDHAKIPALYVVYQPPHYWFRVYSINTRGLGVFTRAQPMTERQYVEKLYEMRGTRAPEAVLSRLYNVMPPEEDESRIWRAEFELGTAVV